VIEVNVDLATREGVDQLWTQVRALGRPVDIACINAGVGVGGLFAPFWIIKAALPHMRPGSCIIATTSEQAYDPAGNLYDYAQRSCAKQKPDCYSILVC
jgi:NAD(P)-dependent dehydrogenase (short-subunit alcohol dehydrogenase family)